MYYILHVVSKKLAVVQNVTEELYKTKNTHPFPGQVFCILMFKNIASVAVNRHG